jgi:DNA primase
MSGHPAGIDYCALRAAIPMEQVLRLLGYRHASRRGQQLRGPCPVHDPSAAGASRCFSAHLGRHFFRCFRCGAQGNQLDLWQLVHELPLYEAALLLCRELRIEPPPATLVTPQNPKIRNSPPPSSRMAT